MEELVAFTAYFYQPKICAHLEIHERIMLDIFKSELYTEVYSNV